LKRIIIVIIAVILIGVSIFTVKNYNTSINNANSSIENADQSNTDQSNTDQSNTTQNNDSTKPGQISSGVTKAIDFKLKDLDGKELSLSDLKGKNVFLNFWATWCPPCKAEMPEIEKLYQETKDSDLVIVSIEIGEPLGTVKSFIDTNKYNFKVLLDLDQSVAAKYNIASIPTSYFIDKEGNIISKKMGAMNINEMKAFIKSLDK